MIYVTATNTADWFNGLMKNRVPIIHLQRNLWRMLYSPEEKGEFLLFLLGTCNDLPPVIPNVHTLGQETARIFKGKNGVIRIDHFEDFLGSDGRIAQQELMKFVLEMKNYSTDLILSSDHPCIVTSLIIGGTA